MNNNFFISSFLSIFIHALFLFFPANLFPVKMADIDIDIIKAPTSIEISIARPISQIKVETKKIEGVSIKDEITPPEEKAINAIPAIGALTRQISSLMVNRPPRYPRLARINGWEGEVTLIANIDNKGEVTSVSIFSSSGFYILDEAAKKAITGWRFRNIPKSIKVKIPVKFILAGGPAE
ncbi:MAG: energy transducer TonB [Candidatus Omnitrophota bacterium]|nr:MAG: energy transducer TonB [Candidatus Omnitrophota bacterium]